MKCHFSPWALAALCLIGLGLSPDAHSEEAPVNVFILAGDEMVLENGVVEVKDDKKSATGTLVDVVANTPQYQFLKDKEGQWIFRDDVMLYDSHPIQNNTKAPAEPVKIGAIGRTGPEKTQAIGVDLMLSHRLGAALNEPVLIIRHGTWNPIWFRRGSRDLSHDYRPPSSGGGSDHEGGWDVIHFNHGIHDTGYRNPENYKEKGEDRYPITIPIEEYEENLRDIVARLKKTGATLIWARITPVMDETDGWKAADIVRYNEVADAIMKENGVIINDLYGEAIQQGFPKHPDVHSVGNLVPKVTEVVMEAINHRKNPTKPLPRVLFIGDSITGSYWAGVQKNLDGKAYVCKNPTNGGHSRYGRESLDGWIDLKTYLLNGEEYLRLTHGVRDALKNLQHYAPQYADRGATLAGLIWFQGEADGQWPSKAESYELHLANLIRDLRKDLEAPDLPVVVAALSGKEGKLNENEKKVYDAQMAVGNAEKYPEFAGNVTSVDTRPMTYPKAECPGGRDRFEGNARSYLKIGDAMAEAMLKLMEK